MGSTPTRLRQLNLGIGIWEFGFKNSDLGFGNSDVKNSEFEISNLEFFRLFSDNFLGISEIVG